MNIFSSLVLRRSKPSRRKAKEYWDQFGTEFSPSQLVTLVKDAGPHVSSLAVKELFRREPGKSYLLPIIGVQSAESEAWRRLYLLHWSPSFQGERFVPWDLAKVAVSAVTLPVRQEAFDLLLQHDGIESELANVVVKIRDSRIRRRAWEELKARQPNAFHLERVRKSSSEEFFLEALDMGLALDSSIDQLKDMIRMCARKHPDAPQMMSAAEQLLKKSKHAKILRFVFDTVPDLQVIVGGDMLKKAVTTESDGGDTIDDGDLLTIAKVPALRKGAHRLLLDVAVKQLENEVSQVKRRFKGYSECQRDMGVLYLPDNPNNDDRLYQRELDEVVRIDPPDLFSYLLREGDAEIKRLAASFMLKYTPSAEKLREIMEFVPVFAEIAARKMLNSSVKPTSDDLAFVAYSFANLAGQALNMMTLPQKRSRRLFFGRRHAQVSNKTEALRALLATRHL